MPVAGEVSRSRSTDCIHRVSVTSNPTHLTTPPVGDSLGVVRSRSYSDTERSLEQVMKDLESMLTEDDHSYENHQRHLSNDSAVGESECVSSPLVHSHCAQPSSSSSACECSHEVSNSVDSAFSNNSSHTNSVSSNEAVNSNVEVGLDSPTPYASSSLPLHARMSSGVSIQSDGMGSPCLIQVSSPKLPHKATLINAKYSSMPALEDPVLNPLSHRHTPSPFSVYQKFRKSSSAGRESHGKKRRKRSGSSVEDNMPEYNPRRSPILTHSPVEATDAEQPSMETTPTGSLCNDSAPLSPTSANISHRFHYIVDPSTELLI